MAENNPLAPIVSYFFDLDISEAAHALERMDESDALEALSALEPRRAAEAIKLLQVSYCAALLKDADEDIFAQIVRYLEPRFAATLFMHMPADARERLIEAVPRRMRQQIRDALEYPEDSLGRIMSTDFLSLPRQITVSRAIERIRELSRRNRHPSSYVYVVDEENKLVGVMNMRDLMLANPQTRLVEVMRQNVFALNEFVDREEAANELSKRHYFAAPVVDSQNHIVGIIKAELLLQGIQEEVTEDLQRFFGAGADERTFSPISFSLKKRLPWLHLNLLAAFLAAGTVAVFENLIARITILAVFLPVVAGQGGNAGAQSLAVVMRGLVMREIPPDRRLPLVLKECWLGCINGLVMGLVTAAVAWLWHGNPVFGLVIGLGMLVNLIVAGFSGAAIPIVMKSLGLDPAQSSNIILTTVTDVIGMFSFLGFASLFAHWLI